MVERVTGARPTLWCKGRGTDHRQYGASLWFEHHKPTLHGGHRTLDRIHKVWCTKQVAADAFTRLRRLRAQILRMRLNCPRKNRLEQIFVRIPRPHAIKVALNQRKLLANRFVGVLLDARIERCFNRQAIAVEVVAGQARIARKFFAEHFDKVWCNATAAHSSLGGFHHCNWLAAICYPLRWGEKSGILHHRQDEVSPSQRPLVVRLRIVAGRCFQQRNQVRTFSGSQLAGMFPEVLLRCDVDAVRTTTEIDRIRIEFENFVFGVRLLDLNCGQRFAELPCKRWLAVEVEVPCQLLRNRGCALFRTERQKIFHSGFDDPPQVNTPVVVELAILGCDECLKKCSGDAIVGHVHPPFDKEALDAPSIAVEDPCGILLRRIFQLLQRRKRLDDRDVEPHSCCCHHKNCHCKDVARACLHARNQSKLTASRQTAAAK
ncbi:hypothetical protein HRbin20_00319 [bacterium HR20]|nr:hypothetical protein HRbin20_00319 [bacterium HR20]